MPSPRNSSNQHPVVQAFMNLKRAANKLALSKTDSLTLIAKDPRVAYFEARLNFIDAARTMPNPSKLLKQVLTIAESYNLAVSKETPAEDPFYQLLTKNFHQEKFPAPTAS